MHRCWIAPRRRSIVHAANVRRAPGGPGFPSQWRPRSSSPTTAPPTTTTRSRSRGCWPPGGAQLSLAYVRHSREYDPAAGGDRRLRRRPPAGAGRPLARGAGDRAPRRDRPVHRAAGWPRWPPPKARSSSCSARTTAPRRAGSSPAAPRRACSRAARWRSASPRRACGPGPGRRSRPSRWPATPTVPHTRPPSRSRRRWAPSVLEGGGNADLILVDSQSSGPEGRIALGGSTRAQLDSARGSVIVLPRGAALSF